MTTTKNGFGPFRDWQEEADKEDRRAGYRGPTEKEEQRERDRQERRQERLGLDKEAKNG